MFSYPVVHPASSLPSAFPFALPSSAASPSIHLGTEDVIQLTETRRFTAFLSSAKLDDRSWIQTLARYYQKNLHTTPSFQFKNVSLFLV